MMCFYSFFPFSSNKRNEKGRYYFYIHPLCPVKVKLVTVTNYCGKDLWQWSFNTQFFFCVFALTQNNSFALKLN